MPLAQGDADGRDYLLTIAAPAGSQNIVNLQLALIHPYLDWINLMTYDFSTAFSRETNFVAPLFCQIASKRDPLSRPIPTLGA